MQEPEDRPRPRADAPDADAPRADESDADEADDAGWPGVPPLPQHLVRRQRLLDQLSDDPQVPLVLVSAPAGTGKTTLVAHWVTTGASGTPTAWVTLEHDDPFWPGFVACLVRLGVAVPTTGLPTGDGPLDPGTRRALALALTSGTEPLTVVVDGPELASATVAADVDFLLRHSGHRLRLVLVTRADPVLPLYRYRLEETLSEVRMADLAFDDEEATALLRGMGVRLSAAAVHRLNGRIGGWATGLRFAGRALAARDEPEAAVDRVVDRDDNVAEYLLGEVLATHPPHVRALLMALSVPDTLEPGLAEALGGRSAERALAQLARVNVFIEAVPGRAGHYRFHPFFRDLLRAEQAYDDPAATADLQRRAGEWFAARHRLGPAVRHLAAAGAWEHATTEVVQHGAVSALLLQDEAAPLVRTLRDLPAEADRPAAVVVRVALALRDGDARWLDAALAGLAPGADAGDERLGLAVALLAAVGARDLDDPAAALTEAVRAEQALRRDLEGERLDPHPELSALVLATCGLAALRTGDDAGALELLRSGAAVPVGGGSAAPQVECLGLLALQACSEGDLARAEALATRAARTAGEAALAASSRSAAPDVALAWVAVERFDLAMAARHLRAAGRAGSVLADPVSDASLALLESRLHAAQGDRASALSRVTAELDARPRAAGRPVQRLHLEVAALQLLRGEPELALAELASVDDPALASEAGLVAGQAHAMLGDDTGAAVALARALEPDAPAPVRVAAALVGCARQLAEGAPVEARRSLAAALAAARATRLRRPFHEAPAPVRQLLTQDPRLATTHAWLFERAGAQTSVPSRSGPEPLEHDDPVEPLTEKEREVLGHLAELLTTEEIAAVMYISVNTVRTHVRNILRKLGVSRRNAAVRVARELDLLPR